jgi:hypothetical protein
MQQFIAFTRTLRNAMSENQEICRRLEGFQVSITTTSNKLPGRLPLRKQRPVDFKSETKPQPQIHRAS